jgi:hypothetical protein
LSFSVTNKWANGEGNLKQSSSRLIQNDINAESLVLMNAYVASEFSSSVMNST